MTQGIFLNERALESLGTVYYLYCFGGFLHIVIV